MVYLKDTDGWIVVSEYENCADLKTTLRDWETLENITNFLLSVSSFIQKASVKFLCHFYLHLSGNRLFKPVVVVVVL